MNKINKGENVHATRSTNEPKGTFGENRSVGQGKGSNQQQTKVSPEDQAKYGGLVGKDRQLLENRSLSNPGDREAILAKHTENVRKAEKDVKVKKQLLETEKRFGGDTTTQQNELLSAENKLKLNKTKLATVEQAIKVSDQSMEKLQESELESAIILGERFDEEGVTGPSEKEFEKSLLLEYRKIEEGLGLQNSILDESMLEQDLDRVIRDCNSMANNILVRMKEKLARVLKGGSERMLAVAQESCNLLYMLKGHVITLLKRDDLTQHQEESLTDLQSTIDDAINHAKDKMKEAYEESKATARSETVSVAEMAEQPRLSEYQRIKKVFDNQALLLDKSMNKEEIDNLLANNFLIANEILYDMEKRIDNDETGNQTYDIASAALNLWQRQKNQVSSILTDNLTLEQKIYYNLIIATIDQHIANTNVRIGRK